MLARYGRGRARFRTVGGEAFARPFPAGPGSDKFVRTMSYRIQVHPEAGSLLRTLKPHVVLRLGRALAELAECLTAADEAGTGELRVDN